jgi:methionyl-tRNA formyltransferase
MKLVFMGTPEFARRPLEHLYRNTEHDILAVVTGPDKPSGRGLKLVSSEVKVAAQRLDLPIYTPESLKDAEFHEAMRRLGADIFVVVAFRVLPESLFSIPPLGSINLHGSLLPKYRGAAPINWALINGETETGLSAFFLKKTVDTGDIIYQEKIAIKPEETFDELYARMSDLAGPALAKTLDLIESGSYRAIPQDGSAATPAPKLSPEDCLIDWGFPADNLVNFVRGLSSKPGAFTAFRGKKIKILRAKAAPMELTGGVRPGKVIKDKNKLIIAVAGGAVEILELKPEGKGLMTGAEFLRGYKPDENDIMGAPV